MSILASTDFWLQFLSKFLLLSYLGLAFFIPYRAGFINLGISAQLIGGSMTLCYTASASSNSILALAAAFLVMCSFGLIPLLLKLYCRTNEVLTTLFLTFMAIPIGQWLMRPSGLALSVASPAIPENMRLPGLIVTPYLTYIHLMSLLAVGIAWLYLTHSACGYKIRALEDNSRIFTLREQRSLHLGALLMSAACLTAYVWADILLDKRRYTFGDYDNIGFVGVAIGLLALKRVLLVPIAAAVIAFVEMLFLWLSVEHGVPQTGARLLYGIAIVAAAIALKRKTQQT